MSRYLYIIEPTRTGFSAFVPDLSGCGATGATHEELEVRIHEAIALYLDKLAIDGEPVPEPAAVAAYADVKR